MECGGGRQQDIFKMKERRWVRVIGIITVRSLQFYFEGSGKLLKAEQT